MSNLTGGFVNSSGTNNNPNPNMSSNSQPQQPINPNSNLGFGVNSSTGMMNSFTNPIPTYNELTSNSYGEQTQTAGVNYNMNYSAASPTGFTGYNSDTTNTMYPNLNTVPFSSNTAFTGHSSGTNNSYTGVTGTTTSYTGTTSGLNTGFNTHIYPNQTFKGIPGCHKCNGTGYKVSKKKKNKVKPCKHCMKKCGFCPKCNNTGLKLKNGKPCKCKGEKSKKKKNK